MYVIDFLATAVVFTLKKRAAVYKSDHAFLMKLIQRKDEEESPIGSLAIICSRPGAKNN